MKKKLDKEIIIKEYQEGLSSIELGKKYNVDKKTILKLLKKNGIERRKNNREYAKIKNRTLFPYNEHWLDELDCQEKLYFLGMFAADGNVRSEENTIRIKLQEQDKYILEKFNELFESKRPLYYEKRCDKRTGRIQTSYEMRLAGKHLKDRLGELGLHPNKTLDYEFPNYLTKEELPHFIRGYFDGDGNVTVFGSNKKGEPRANVTIVGSKKFIPILKERIEENLGVYINFYEYKNFDTIKIERQKDTKKFLDWIYKDSKIHLIRKYNDYIKFVKSRDFNKIDCKEMHRILEENADYIIDRYKQLGNMTAVGKEFGTNPTTMTRFLEKHNVEIVNRKPKKNKK